MNPPGKKTISILIDKALAISGKEFKHQTKAVFDVMWDMLSKEQTDQLIERFGETIPLLAKVLR